MVVALWREEGMTVNFLVVSKDFTPSSGGISTYTKELGSALVKKWQVTVLALGATNAATFDQACPSRSVRMPPIPRLRAIAFFIYMSYLLGPNGGPENN